VPFALIFPYSKHVSCIIMIFQYMWKYVNMNNICVQDVVVLMFLSLNWWSDLVNKNRQASKNAKKKVEPSKTRTLWFVFLV
jgi:hypothetical protein